MTYLRNIHGIPESDPLDNVINIVCTRMCASSHHAERRRKIALATSGGKRPSDQ